MSGKSDASSSNPPREQTVSDFDNGSGNAKDSDPGVVQDKSKKLTGTAAPGSHSALFGLTPDGHKETNVDYSSKKPNPAQGGEDPTSKSDDVAGRDLTATSSRATGSRPSITDPKAAGKVNVGGDAITAGLKGDKPGTGSAVTAPSQLTGKVGKDV